MQAGNIRTRLQARLKKEVESDKILEERKKAFATIDARSTPCIELLSNTKDKMVFEYAIKNIPIFEHIIWDTILRFSPGALVRSAIEKFWVGNQEKVFYVIYNPEISDSDLEYVLDLAKSKNRGLDYIFANLRGNMSTRLALKLSEIARPKDIENLDQFYGLFALRIFCIQRMLEQKSIQKTGKYYIENYAASDMETWTERYKPSIADFLFVAATLFCCIKSLGVTGFKPNILLELK